MEAPIALEFGEPVEVLDRGTTRPLLCRLEEPSGRTDLWVVKLPSLKRPETAAAEIAAHRLLGPFGLCGLEIGLVALPSREHEAVFDDSTEEGQALRKAVRDSECRSCFASRYVIAVEHVDGMFRQRSPDEVLRLFFFDAFIWHADRTHKTPNILWLAGRMIPIDHARAFHGIEEIDETGLPTSDYCETHRERWADHAALGYLRSQWQKGTLSPQNCDQIVSEIQAFGVKSLQELVNSWPDSLPSATFRSDLRRFVKARFNLLPALAQEISDALSR